MNKKKILISIGIILVIVALALLGTKVLSVDWNLKDTRTVSIKQSADINPYKDFNIFCIDRDRQLPGETDKVSVATYKIMGISTIKDDFENYFEYVDSGDNKDTFHKDGYTETNKVMASIIRLAEINKNNRARTEKLGDDEYQLAIWKYMHTWLESDAWAPTTGYHHPYAWGNISVPYNNNTETGSMTKEEENKAAAIIAKAKQMAKASIANGDMDIQEIEYKTETKKIASRTEKDNGYVEIGPFRYKFGGTLTQFDIYYNDNKDNISSAKMIVYEGNTAKEIDKLNLNSETKFWLWIPKTEIEGKTKLNFNIKTDGGITGTNTKIYIMKATTSLGKAHTQTLIYVDQTGGTEKQKPDTYILNQEKEVELQKQDENGNALKVAGIEFKIYNITNEVTPIATLTTDENGSTQKTKLYTNTQYIIKETQNQKYGYKALNMKDKIAITNGEILESNQNSAKFQITDNSVITIKNQKELANVEILKEGDNGDKLKGVQFIIETHTKTKKDYRAYLRLYDTNGKFVDALEGDIIINDNLTATSVDGKTHYKVENKHFYKTVTQNGEEKKVDKLYSELTEEEKSQLTKFVTDGNGKVSIHNLEINSGVNLSTGTVYKYDYTAYEVYNPNYGYGSGKNTSLTGNATKLTLNQTSQIKITNAIDLGNLKLEKYDEDNTNIKLENVGFAIEISPSPRKAYAYLALYNKDGKIVPSIKGTATINRKNVANDTEYKVSYYCTDKSISEMTEEEKANLMANTTTFVTESDGTLTVNNLEVYEAKTGNKYTYKLIETTNSNYGYVTDSVELGNITLESNSTVENKLANKQKYTKLSGYVWIENPAGKSNNYDLVYTDGDLSNDIKLTDLYVIKDGQLVKNPEAVTPVEIKLRDKKTGEFIKTLPDEFDENGKYTFIDVEVEKLADYEVVFVYNGFYYTTVVEQLDKDNGSKVKEVVTEREALNNKFATVKNNGEVVATDGTTNTVEYYKDGHTSTVSKLNFDATLSANTTAAEYNLREAFNSIKSSATTLTQELENVNMGIVLREQPKISINNDIYSVLVEFEGYKYNYKYNGRQNYYENKNGDDIGVKFEQESTEKRYTRTVYASDIQAAKDQNKEIKVSVTYKMQVANESRTLSVMTRQLINYFDARYEIKAVGLGLDETTHTITDTLTFSEAQVVEGHPEYKSAVIDFNQTIEAGNSNVKSLYITFDIQRDAILDLLNQKSTYHNAVELLSYTSYYGAETSKVDGVQFTTDQTEAGKLYAGIDKMSEPGNMEIVLVDHPSVDGTKILDTTNFEDDTSSAPSLLLEAGEAREISGTIWEDIATNTTDNQKLGDGIYDEGNEKPIQNVTVELHKVNSNGNIEEAVATYSNGEPASTKTNDQGKYTFGYYDENNKKYVGVLPGKYVIEYTYDDKSYIVGGKNIDPNEYKSTIIVSEVIENAFNGQNQRWYIVEENYRYSDARDNIYLRPEYNSEIDANITVTNSTYNNVLSIDSMEAHTPIMDIGIEFTETDEADALVLEFIRELENVDFGIIERPDIDITIEKQITGLEVTSQTGSNIIPKGDPSNPNASMQYVKTGLDGLVSAEIESKLLQSATLNLEYTITIVNNSDKDYLETDYYYYGRNGMTETTSKVKLVVDYLDATMALDETQNNEIWEVKGLDDLYNTETKQGLVHEEVYNELKSGNYHILTTRAFEEVGTGNEKSVKLYASKALAVSDSINEENHVEIIELTGKRTIKESKPGNYNPTTSTPDESDNDKVELVVTPPTGTTVNYIVYIIAAMATFAILVLGIVTIKKKIIK